MSPQTTLVLFVFLTVSSAVLLVLTLVSNRGGRLDARLDDLTGRGNSQVDRSTVSQFAKTTLPKMGTAMLPTDDKERTFLKTRLIHAGLYGKEAMSVFLGVKLILMVGPALLGIAAGLCGLVSLKPAFLVGACLGILGMIGPSFWLDWAKAARQSLFRRSLPDALDLLVVCLEGGLSLPASLKRVSSEIKSAHPKLAYELNIVQREIQLGRSAGDSLQQFALRCDLEEIRGLSSVIVQSERYGASLVKSLRVHADTLRLKRQQRAEEMAQKASVKMLFPTLLFIFPAIFIVILGPAVFQIYEMISTLAK